MKRVPALDLLRALAIALVFTFHYQIIGGPHWLQALGRFGWAGVDLFFVLSGYLITQQLIGPVTEGEAPALTAFYVRRAFRILPSYWMVLAVYFLVPGFAEGNTIAPLWRFLSFTQNFGLDFRASRSFSNAWSLCIEEQLYFLLPLLIVFLARRSSVPRVAAGLLLSCASGMLIRSHAWLQFVAPFYWPKPHAGIAVPFYREIYYPTYCRLDPILLGVGVALLQSFRPQAWEKLACRGNLSAAAGLLILALATLLWSHEYSYWASVFGYPMVALGFGCLLVSGLSPVSWLGQARFPGAKPLAELAFTVYLLHKPVIHLMHRAFERLALQRDGYPALLLSITAVLLAAWILRTLIELPFLRLRRKWEPSPALPTISFRISSNGCENINGNRSYLFIL